jgi:hypothetical protein
MPASSSHHTAVGQPLQQSAQSHACWLPVGLQMFGACKHAKQRVAARPRMLGRQSHTSPAGFGTLGRQSHTSSAGFGQPVLCVCHTHSTVGCCCCLRCTHRNTPPGPRAPPRHALHRTCIWRRADTGAGRRKGTSARPHRHTVTPPPRTAVPPSALAAQAHGDDGMGAPSPRAPGAQRCHDSRANHAATQPSRSTQTALTASTRTALLQRVAAASSHTTLPRITHSHVLPTARRARCAHPVSPSAGMSWTFTLKAPPRQALPQPRNAVHCVRWPGSVRPAAGRQQPIKWHQPASTAGRQQPNRRRVWP